MNNTKGAGLVGRENKMTLTSDPMHKKLPYKSLFMSNLHDLRPHGNG